MRIEQNILDDIVQLNEIEPNKIKILTTIFYIKSEEKKKEILNRLQYELPQNNKNEYTHLMDSYNALIDQIIQVYEQQFCDLQKKLQEAEIQQRYTINSIISNNMEYQKAKGEEKNKFKDIGVELVTKKIDYDIIIEECQARIKCCIANVEKAIIDIFKEDNEIVQLVKHKDSIFRKLYLFFTKSNKNIQVLNKCKKELQSITKDVEKKVKSTQMEIIAFDMQISKIKEVMAKKSKLAIVN